HRLFAVGYSHVHLSLPALPPSSPLFPYTTLFRSLVADEDRLPGGAEVEERREDELRAVDRHPVAPCLLRPAGVRPRLVDHREGRDRKSTRLNSSHDQISYAVFCLKKKMTERDALG